MRPRQRRAGGSSRYGLSADKRLRLQRELGRLDRLEEKVKDTLKEAERMKQTVDEEKARLDEERAKKKKKNETERRELSPDEVERITKLIDDLKSVRDRHMEAGQRYVERLERFRWTIGVMFGVRERPAARGSA